MVRPRVAREFHRAGGSGLALMYPAFDWSCLAPGHYGYQRACDLISGGKASTGHLGHQCSHASSDHRCFNQHDGEYTSDDDARAREWTELEVGYQCLKSRPPCVGVSTGDAWAD